MGQCMSESTTPDVGELLDRLVDNTDKEEATKAKLTQLDPFAEFAVYETVNLHVALGKSD